jgi:hypothetical protein
MVGRLLPAVPWRQWIAVLVVVLLIGQHVIHLSPDFGSRHMYLRAALLAAAIGLAFAFDDSAAPLSGALPSPLRVRRGIRLALSLVPWGLMVALTLAIGATGEEIEATLILSPDGAVAQLPAGRLLLEGAVLGTWALALAAVVSKRWDDEPGKVAAPAIAVLYGLGWAIPESHRPWALPSDPRWVSLVAWWGAALALGVVVLLAASWDTRVGRPFWRGISNL